MGSRELVESLRQECDKKVEQIIRDTEALSEEIKGEASRRVEQFRGDYKGLQSSEIRKDTLEIIREAEGRVRSARLLSERELSDRLYKLARALLGRLRDKTYDAVFSVLVRELPNAKWQEVAVNPEDVDLARTHFPDTEIKGDDSLTGGLEAFADNGRIRVINSFEKRLEKAWHAMLPIMISDVYEEFAE